MAQPARYFHVCPVILGIGSVIKAGNFGRVIDQYRVATLGAMAARELCYEVVRLKHYPIRPSRLTSLFFFSSHEAALHHLQKFSPTSLIYEVELTDATAEVFHGDMSFIEAQPPNPEYPAVAFLMTVAAQYWTGRNVSADLNSEFLSVSDARIVGVHDPRLSPEELEVELNKLRAAAASASN